MIEFGLRLGVWLWVLAGKTRCILEEIMKLINFNWGSRTTWIGIAIALLGLGDAFTDMYNLGLSPILSVLLGIGIATNRAALDKIVAAAADRL